jgi:predicted secreted protein
MNRHPRFIPLLAALAVAGCSREPRAVSHESPYTDTATYSDPAKAIRAAPGTEFQISLKSNHSTGYQWVLVDSAGPVHRVGSRYVVPSALRDRDGAGGTEWWTFRAVHPGEGIISMTYVRPWENTAPGTPPASASSSSKEKDWPHAE